MALSTTASVLVPSPSGNLFRGPRKCWGIQPLTAVACRPQWRSDWEPVWMTVLLFSILLSSLGFISLIMPSDEPLERSVQAIQNAAVGQHPTMLGTSIERRDLAEP